jgi:hypothetical protein
MEGEKGRTCEVREYKQDRDHRQRIEEATFWTVRTAWTEGSKSSIVLWATLVVWQPGIMEFLVKSTGTWVHCPQLEGELNPSKGVEFK